MVVAICCVVIWRLIDWFTSGRPEAEPWDDPVSAEIAKDDVTPLCHRCLTPNDPLTDFCSECGAPVGTYTNWMPFPYLFSLGHTLRLGTAGEFKRSPLTVMGFFLLSLIEYTVFAPVYWFMLVKGLRAGPARAQEAPEAPLVKR